MEATVAEVQLRVRARAAREVPPWESLYNASSQVIAESNTFHLGQGGAGGLGGCNRIVGAATDGPQGLAVPILKR